jgi:hypothetical protein
LVWHFVWSAFTRRYFDDKDGLSVGFFHIQARLVIRAHQIIVAYHFLFDGFNPIGIYTLHWAQGSAILFFHTYHDVAAACLVEVIGKSTDSAVNGIGVPSSLVFYSLTLYGASAEEFFYIDGELHFSYFSPQSYNFFPISAFQKTVSTKRFVDLSNAIDKNCKKLKTALCKNRGKLSGGGDEVGEWVGYLKQSSPLLLTWLA